MRSLQKFGRDLLMAALAGAVVYFTDHVADLGMSPELAPIVTAAVLLGYRAVRGYMGYDPEEAK